MSTANQPLPPVPRKYAGQWIAWNRAQTAVVASGRTFDEARRAAEAAGEPNPILAKAPRANVRFLGGVQLNRASTGQASAVGGHEVELVPGSVTLQMSQAGLTYHWQTIVQFLEVGEPEDEVALLGYAGFLEFFQATFNSEIQELELTPNSRLPRAN
jgi:hypothetical protein